MHVTMLLRLQVLLQYLSICVLGSSVVVETYTGLVVQTLFHDCLQHLFAERPEDPLKFVVEHLQQRLKERDAGSAQA